MSLRLKNILNTLFILFLLGFSGWGQETHIPRTKVFIDLPDGFEVEFGKTSAARGDEFIMFNTFNGKGYFEEEKRLLRDGMNFENVGLKFAKTEISGYSAVIASGDIAYSNRIMTAAYFGDSSSVTLVVANYINSLDNRRAVESAIKSLTFKKDFEYDPLENVLFEADYETPGFQLRKTEGNVYLFSIPDSEGGWDALNGIGTQESDSTTSIELEAQNFINFQREAGYYGFQTNESKFEKDGITYLITQGTCYFKETKVKFHQKTMKKGALVIITSGYAKEDNFKAQIALQKFQETVKFNPKVK